MLKLSTAILAGGKSRRMNGKNKSFLTLGKVRFIDKILAEVSEFDETLISVGLHKGYHNFPYPLIEDEVIDIGPLGGLYSCLKACRNEYLFVCATDMPLIKKELIEFMRLCIDETSDCFVIQSDGKTHPLCAIYKKSMIPRIEAAIKAKDYRMMNLLKVSKVKYIPLEYSCFDSSIVTNVNCPQELTKLKGPSVFCISGRKNTGKTTLVTKLIRAFKDEQYRVGVIKHDGHEFEIDREGTDTYKYQQAGSDATMIYSNSKFAFIKNQREIAIDELIPFFYEMDILIIEGLKNSTFPKIELVSDQSVCDARYLIAIAVAKNFHHEQIQIVHRDDVATLVKLLKEEVIEKDERLLWTNH